MVESDRVAYMSSNRFMSHCFKCGVSASSRRKLFIVLRVIDHEPSNKCYQGSKCSKDGILNRVEKSHPARQSYTLIDPRPHPISCGKLQSLNM